MSRDDPGEIPLRERLAANPRPALVWTAVVVVLVALEFGALAAVALRAYDAVAGLLMGGVRGALPSVLAGALGAAASGLSPLLDPVRGALAAGSELPTLLSRGTIPNQGYYVPPGAEGYARSGWQGTWMGLEPKWPWAIRVLAVFAYSFFFAYWVWRGYRRYVEHYRQAEWTPRDDVVRRLRGHRWGQFGIVVVFVFLTVAVFAPALGPTTVDRNIANPCSHTLTFWDDRVGEVNEVPVCDANFNSASNGEGGQNVGPLQYDKYARYHPFGTTPTPGKDMFTFMMAGARVSLFIGLLAIGLGALVATTFALVTAYYKGLADLTVVLASDSIMTVPGLLLLIIVSTTFSDHWINQVYSGGLLIALVLAFTYWPLLWRAIRGPAFQVAEQEWIDAARSYGQEPSMTMRKHMFPYVVGYLLIYASMSFGGVIITTSALSFLPGGLGVQAPTPEWGRAIAMGQSYIATPSWHISLIPGVSIVVVVTAFNALGDGVRDAIDPQSEGGESGEVAAAGGGGG